MDRREFLRCSLAGGALLMADRLFSTGEVLGASPVAIIDAHAHPDMYAANSRRAQDTTSTLSSINALGMAASSFAAVGDAVFLSRDRIPGTEFQNTKVQLEWWIDGIVKRGRVKSVLQSSDLARLPEPDAPPGAILSIEGGDPLEGKPERVEAFYRMGVRMITLIHYRNNEIGDVMKMYGNVDPGQMHNGLTSAGRKIVERMQDIGIVVDVAHAHQKTLKGIVDMSLKPLLDSHTSPCSSDNSERCGRFRTWAEMEWIAKKGGVVCTWPIAYKNDRSSRLTFSDWAKEILEMKTRLGIEHIGLGTDGGGQLPQVIEGYRDVRDLTKLMAAMHGVGLSKDDISAYMGGNVLRVLKQCLG
jgi:microsomal dipeptidase-like Zn-dependent dipeptidase